VTGAGSGIGRSTAEAAAELGATVVLVARTLSKLEETKALIEKAGGKAEVFVADVSKEEDVRALRDYVDGGGAILLCSHEMTLIQAFCHHCILLDQGRIMATGEPTDVITIYQERIAADEALKKAENPGLSHLPANEFCWIQSVHLKTDNNGPVFSGGSLSIELEIAVTQQIDDLACSITIGNAEITAIATLTYGYPEGNITLKPPMTTIRCHIDHLPLAPGNYDMRFCLFAPASTLSVTTLGWEDVAFPMKVISKDVNKSILMRQQQNLVHILAGWELASHQSDQD
jgi:hypothetical protein